MGSGVNVLGCTCAKIEAKNVTDFGWATKNRSNPGIADNITGMVYLNTTMVFGVAHLRVPAHNDIYDCI